MRKLLPVVLSLLIPAPVHAQPALTDNEMIVLQAVNLLDSVYAWYPARGDMARPIFEMLTINQARTTCIMLRNGTPYSQIERQALSAQDRDIALHNVAASLAGVTVLCPQYRNQIPRQRS